MTRAVASSVQPLLATSPLSDRTSAMLSLTLRMAAWQCVPPRQACAPVQIYDTNGDGVLERSDLLRVADALAGARGFEPESAAYESLAAHYEALWAPLQRRAGGALRARVTLEAYVAWHEEVLADVAHSEKTLGAMAGLVFDLFDEDGDGIVHLAEYEQFARRLASPAHRRVGSRAWISMATAA